VSDPAKPVPFVGYTASAVPEEHMVADQRFAATRTDVLVYATEPLEEDLTVAGPVSPKLFVSTTGTDSDWVVKLIDVYPDEVAGDEEMGGYQLMVSADVFRGRYRESLSNPRPITADKPLLYRFALPTANHVFLPGHRIMVQVQSSWFPLYDRNPQTFVPSIFWAKPENYKKATQRVYHTPGEESYIELPVVKAE
jgi:putative CocE/NonD family hydrolase